MLIFTHWLQDKTGSRYVFHASSLSDSRPRRTAAGSPTGRPGCYEVPDAISKCWRKSIWRSWPYNICPRCRNVPNPQPHTVILKGYLSPCGKHNPCARCGLTDLDQLSPERTRRQPTGRCGTAYSDDGQVCSTHRFTPTVCHYS